MAPTWTPIPHTRTRLLPDTRTRERRNHGLAALAGTVSANWRIWQSRDPTPAAPFSSSAARVFPIIDICSFISRVDASAPQGLPLFFFLCAVSIIPSPARVSHPSTTVHYTYHAASQSDLCLDRRAVDIHTSTYSRSHDVYLMFRSRVNYPLASPPSIRLHPATDVAGSWQWPTYCI